MKHNSHIFAQKADVAKIAATCLLPPSPHQRSDLARVSSELTSTSHTPVHTCRIVYRLWEILAVYSAKVPKTKSKKVATNWPKYPQFSLLFRHRTYNGVVNGITRILTSSCTQIVRSIPQFKPHISSC